MLFRSTIDDENLEILKNELEVKSVKGNENNIATLALRKFLERCRKKTGKSLKHWCVTELGEDRGRIHLHGIFFGNQAAELVIEKWKYGYVFIGNFVNEKTINYISKYMLKDGFMFECVWTGTFDFYEFSDDASVSGFSGKIVLRETPF